jgi:MFS family permease
VRWRSPAPPPSNAHWASRLPFFYGWLIIAVAFVTMALAVTSRTAFSLLMPPLIDEFGWNRGVAAGAFSFGFLVSALTSPLVGRIADRYGPRVVIEAGVLLVTLGLLIAPAMQTTWHFYATLGVLVGCGANLMSFTAHSLFLPQWFVRRRALAISIAFSGVGIGAIVLLPWLQGVIDSEGWRSSCLWLGLIVLLVLGPINLLVHKRPQDLGLEPDGTHSSSTPASGARSLVVDAAWAQTEWTLARALRTARFWWIAAGYFSALVAWYAVQVHQTKYLVEIGFSPLVAAWALGMVSAAAIPGQIGLGALSDRIGREWIWTVGCAGFAICYATLIALQHWPSTLLLWLMVGSQGFLGYALASVMGPIVFEIFEGPHYGAIFGAITVALVTGGAAGPWIAGGAHDLTGSYVLAFAFCIACCVFSAAAIWVAAPRKVRRVR